MCDQLGQIACSSLGSASQACSGAARVEPVSTSSTHQEPHLAGSVALLCHFPSEETRASFEATPPFQALLQASMGKGSPACPAAVSKPAGTAGKGRTACEGGSRG